MEQYIKKSALVAEIENLLDKGRYHEEYDCAYRDGNNGALYALKGKLNTLEVKEVDLDELELTLDDIKTIDKLLNQCVDYSNPYQEVLKRFKAMKETKD